MINNQEYSELEELIKHFGPNKNKSKKLADAYFNLGLIDRGARVAACGDYLEFAHEINIETGEISEKGRLHNANFCRDLLCPMCNWRKSLVVYAQLCNVLSDERINGQYKALMLTLTIPNPSYEDLGQGIDKLLKGFDRLLKRRKYKRIIKGYFRALEITINTITKTFHPHLHVLLLVPLSYGKFGEYLNHKEVLQDWRDCTGDQSITQVNIKVAYAKKSVAEIRENYHVKEAVISFIDIVREVSKYITKYDDDFNFDSEIIYFMIKGLHHRRANSYGGIMKTVYHDLCLEDIEDADLIHVNDSVPEPVAQLITVFRYSGSEYKFINERIERNESVESQCC